MKKLYPLFSLILVVIIRSIITEFGLASSFFFPSLAIIFEVGKEMFLEGSFHLDIMFSVSRVVIAFIIGVIGAVIVGSLFYIFPKSYSLFSPLITFLRFIPVEGLFPLLIMFLGLGEEPKIGLLFLGVFFPLLLLIVKELNSIPRELNDLTVVLGFSKAKKLKTFLQGIAPMIYENARVVIGLCRGYIVVAEMIAAEHGIGYMIWQAHKYANIPKIYVALITLGSLGLLIDNIMRHYKNNLFPYLEPNG